MRIARVFPRRTNATPEDELTFTGPPPRMLPLEMDEIHVSVTFTEDLPRAEWLAYQWEVLGVPVRIGGPARNEPGGEFVPGMYIKQGYVITSRGCPNRCWFCAVPEREGYELRELTIKDGWNVLDDNLLACSDRHIKDVIDMLKHQRERVVFTGGLEAARLKPWHVEALRELHPKRMYFAYDTPNDYEPLVEAGRMLLDAGFTVTSHALKCYCLIGYPGDTQDKAEKRLNDTVAAGFMPFAMLYQADGWKPDKSWAGLRRRWLLPEVVAAKIREVWGNDRDDAAGQVYKCAGGGVGGNGYAEVEEDADAGGTDEVCE